MLLRLLCLFALCCQQAAWGGASQPKTQTIHDPVEFANLLIIDKQFSQAEKFINQVLKNEKLSANQQQNLNYLLGLAFAGQGDYQSAVEVLRAILDQTPATTYIRLSLGRVLFLNGNDRAAERQFDLVLADNNADSNQRQLALEHLRTIRERNGWTFSSSFNITESSNIGNAPDEGMVVYIGGLPFSTNVEKERGYGAAYGFSADYRQRFMQQAQFEGGFSYNGDIVPGAWDASTDIQTRIGARYLMKDGSVGAFLLGGNNWSHGHTTSNNVGARADWNKIVQRRWRTRLYFQYLKQNNLNNDLTDANLYYLEGRIDGALSDLTSGYIRLSGQKNAAKHALYSYHSVGMGTQLQRDFPFGITAGVEFSISRLLYDGAHPLVQHRERFLTKSITTSLLKRDWRIFGFAPKINYTHTVKQSNIAIFSHKKDVVLLNFSRDF